MLDIPSLSRGPTGRSSTVSGHKISVSNCDRLFEKKHCSETFFIKDQSLVARSAVLLKVMMFHFNTIKFRCNDVCRMFNSKELWIMDKEYFRLQTQYISLFFSEVFAFFTLIINLFQQFEIFHQILYCDPTKSFTATGKCDYYEHPNFNNFLVMLCSTRRISKNKSFKNDIYWNSELNNITTFIFNSYFFAGPSNYHPWYLESSL